MRLVGGFNRGHFLRAERDVHSGDEFFELLELRDPNDGGRHPRRLQNPRKGHLCRGDTTLLRHLVDRCRHREIILLEIHLDLYTTEPFRVLLHDR